MNQVQCSLDNLYDFLHWKHSIVPPHYLFIRMITTMFPCKYPEIKFISFLIFSQYQMRIKKIIKIKNIFLPTYPNFFQEVTGNTHIIFLGLIFFKYVKGSEFDPNCWQIISFDRKCIIECDWCVRWLIDKLVQANVARIYFACFFVCESHFYRHVSGCACGQNY